MNLPVSESDRWEVDQRENPQIKSQWTGSETRPVANFAKRQQRGPRTDWKHVEVQITVWEELKKVLRAAEAVDMTLDMMKTTVRKCILREKFRAFHSRTQTQFLLVGLCQTPSKSYAIGQIFSDKFAKPASYRFAGNFHVRQFVGLPIIRKLLFLKICQFA